MTYRFKIYDFWGFEQVDPCVIHGNSINSGMEDVARHLIRFNLLKVDKMGNPEEAYLIKAYKGRELNGEYWLRRTGKYYVQYFRRTVGKKSTKHNIYIE